ncbi:MAG: SDR family oxidoreductase [Pseudonocardia sp.]|uniref:SDR family NAD(P)-dependent oxidoreductase n=1 Tax=unclassified Pseudonocardia TaxID=2619320 RepID=UPI000AFBDC5E|nr:MULTISPECIES: glucose 1-dehydrogenase [unclassified Pseudonocardia]MBN9107664.1 SDR family oxidoreductase [Pseudonocardia sp.]
MGSMEGKAGLVTGAASGIGRATAVRAAAEGASVLVSDLESAREGGEETVAIIRKDGGTAEFQVCDVSRPDDHDALVATVLERWGKLDFAHNNAGVGGGGKLLADIADEEFDRVIAINLRGVFLGMKRQIKAMLAGEGGSIVNTASNAGLRGVKRLAPYTAAKHGLVGLTKNAAVEYAEDLIRVNAVAPGTIMTGFARGATPERLAEIMKPQALQRIGEPEEVAAAVVWLMSDDASFVTGVTLPVDAGSVAGW